ncbi:MULTISPECIES: ankyrin repeat domain-containing protein [unclassified Erwinia]|uniref:ankyrin repeat domain-containing protein n=1 Tax=unclassified Erwinia TaxID=2622719 RepID=UPI0009EE734A|nr:ankyrin repeat domain-containing protein [Erwinia sp. ErVv1]
MLKKLTGILKKIKKIQVLSAFVMFFLVSGCHAMKKYPPENFFHGTQLTLAQDIYDSNVDAIKKDVEKTDLNKPGRQDMTLLFYAFQSASDKDASRLNIISELVRLGANPLQRVPDVGSVAGVAARADSPVFMQALLKGGMSPNVKIMNTPVIMVAADDERIPTMDLLLKNGADVNQRDSLGATALMAALDGIQLDAVSWLLDKGADPRLTETNSGWSFSKQLLSAQKKLGGDKKVDKKLQEIIDKGIAHGMEWPPSAH